MPPPPDDFSDPRLDALFQASPRLSDDFQARTLARLQREASEAPDEDALLEEWLVVELSAQRVEPGADFTARALDRIRTSEDRVVRFPWGLATRTAAGIAAAVALGLAVGRGGPEGGQPELLAQLEPPPAQVDRQSVAPTSEGLAIDPATSALLMLAEGLDGDARWLLSEGDGTTLLAFAQ